MTSTSPLESLYGEALYRIDSKMLVLIPRSWEEITEDEKVLLQKILGAVKLSLASIQIVSRKEFSTDDFIAFDTRMILSFGSALTGSLRKYEVVDTGNVRVLVADELRKLDDVTKRNLWLALKQMFQ